MCKFVKPSVLYNNMPVSSGSIVTELDYLGRIFGGCVKCFCSPRINTSSKSIQSHMQWIPEIQSREIRMKGSGARKCGG